jgi:hypothetical protein
VSGADRQQRRKEVGIARARGSVCAQGHVNAGAEGVRADAELQHLLAEGFGVRIARRGRAGAARDRRGRGRKRKKTDGCAVGIGKGGPAGNRCAHRGQHCLK